MIPHNGLYLLLVFGLFPALVQATTPPMCASYDGVHLEIPCVNTGEIYQTSFLEDSSGFVLTFAEKVSVADVSQCAVADLIMGTVSLPCVELLGAPAGENLYWANLNLLMAESIRLELVSAGVLAEVDDCTDNLDRFSGIYSLAVSSRELGIADYSSEGEAICGTGNDFFDDIPSIGSIIVNGNQVTLSADDYSVSASVQDPTEPKIPLINGTFYKESSSLVSTANNSCGTKSPYVVGQDSFPEDGGTTTFSAWVYLQDNAISVVAEVFWIEDESEILSSCHGVIVIQGDKL